MNKKPGFYQFPNFGFPTIVFIFSMICIVTFSVTAFMTAHSDYKVSQDTATQNTLYYEAEAQALTKLSEIDHELLNIYNTTYDSTEYYLEVTDYLNSLGYGLQEHLETDDENYITFQFSQIIIDSQTLDIMINIKYPVSDTSSFYEIAQWQVVE